ncbi:hypothetical protein ACS0TY_025750 [Phlomoides rotata]
MRQMQMMSGVQDQAYCASGKAASGMSSNERNQRQISAHALMPPPGPSGKPFTTSTNNKLRFSGSSYAIYSIASIESVVTKSISNQSFTLGYIETAIQCYKTQIGEGGFGSMYRGTLPDGQEVAVKVRSATSTQGTREFDNEQQQQQANDEFELGGDPFSKWLNPVFAKGHNDKLQFQHVPQIPQTESTEEASLSLQHFLREQKTQASSLPDAIFNTIRTLLAKNAVFAEVQEIKLNLKNSRHLIGSLSSTAYELLHLSSMWKYRGFFLINELFKENVDSTLMHWLMFWL